jgi:hypothetical protein
MCLLVEELLDACFGGRSAGKRNDRFRITEGSIRKLYCHMSARIYLISL